MSDENERHAFIKALNKDEDDMTTRLVYADWLDENGEHEEADRMRKWDAAKAWLVKLCQVNNPRDDQDPDQWYISYERLLELGLEAVARVENGDDEGFWIHCMNNMNMCDALRANGREFWQSWSIVTGIPLPADIEEKSSFSCAC